VNNVEAMTEQVFVRLSGVSVERIQGATRNNNLTAPVLTTQLEIFVSGDWEGLRARKLGRMKLCP
jgi:hypothetical protein